MKNEKNYSCGFSYYKNVANFEAFLRDKNFSKNLLFLGCLISRIFFTFVDVVLPSNEPHCQIRPQQEVVLIRRHQKLDFWVFWPLFCCWSFWILRPLMKSAVFLAFEIGMMRAIFYQIFPKKRGKKSDEKIKVINVFLFYLFTQRRYFAKLVL